MPGGATLVSPSFKIIPDSELVYGPAARDFDIDAFIAYFDSYLARHQEDVEGTVLSGPQIVQLVADRFSVNPRLLLAALEYRAGWVSQPQPNELVYPMGRARAGVEGLYRQLAWAADQLNWGYYGRSEGGLTGVTIGDTTIAFARRLPTVQPACSALAAATARPTTSGSRPPVRPASLHIQPSLW